MKMKLLEVKHRAEWRDWLAANHDKIAEVWLVFYKKSTGTTSIDYNDSVEEALCYGWIDSIIKKLDDKRYAHKFTPRKENSVWSPSNKNRVERLIEAGLMTEDGMRLIEAAKRSGKWDLPQEKPQISLAMPEDFINALRNNFIAGEIFNQLSTTNQNQYLTWINTAKRPETREKRIKESIQLLAEGKKLGLK